MVRGVGRKQFAWFLPTQRNRLSSDQLEPGCAWQVGCQRDGETGDERQPGELPVAGSLPARRWKGDLRGAIAIPSDREAVQRGRQPRSVGFQECLLQCPPLVEREPLLIAWQALQGSDLRRVEVTASDAQSVPFLLAVLGIDSDCVLKAHGAHRQGSRGRQVEFQRQAVASDQGRLAVRIAPERKLARMTSRVVRNTVRSKARLTRN